eukprot:GHVR01137661.1.p1 GENE.GHVR01137661.1~~GHVR01137661.1.p1  ORF type:complete len:137 (+),score=6.71 GHVR01137661.1:73-483(+)
MMLKLLLLPALVYATRYCIYSDDKCSTSIECYGCTTAPNLAGVEVSGGYELKEGDVYRETWTAGNCPGSPTVSSAFITGNNTQLDTCYTGEVYFNITNNSASSVKFGNANSVGISMILLGLLLSLSYFNIFYNKKF